MQNFEVRAHTRFYIRYHIVWIVKKRKKILVGDELEKRLVEILCEIGIFYEMRVVEVVLAGDHFHLFCETYPRISPALSAFA